MIATLLNAIFWIALVVFVVVEAMLLYTAFRYRGKPGAKMPKQITGNVPLEIGWTVFPAIVLAIVFALTLGTLRALNTVPVSGPDSQGTNTIHVRVIGHQWWWEFQYPDLGIVTADEIHMPVGSTLIMDIETADVIHSFWVPELGSKEDAVPGQNNHMWWKPTEIGVYWGHCTEYCGTEHALMQTVAVVESPEDFQAWVQNAQAAPVNIDGLTGEAAQGRDVFMSSGCTSCHTIQGTKAIGQVGPNLTHFASRKAFAGAAFDNTHDNVARWVRVPQEMKPGVFMPNLGLTETQANQVATFLESLK